jgi:hypothetical protein
MSRITISALFKPISVTRSSEYEPLAETFFHAPNFKAARVDQPGFAAW